MPSVAVVAGEKYLKGLPASEVTTLAAALTLPNPRYQQALKFSRNPTWAVQNIPKTIGFYTRHTDGVISVPRGYEVKVDKFQYNVVKRPTEWPVPALTPRDWQNDVIATWKDKDKLESFDAVHVATPGSGKTICGLFVLALMKQKSLVIVHTRQIMQAWIEDCKLMFGDKVVPGIWQGQKRTTGEHITIAMMQTLKNVPADKWAEEFGMVMVDECHHTPSQTLFSIMSMSHAAYRMGVTATSERSDGLDELITWACGPIRTVADKENSTVDVKVIKVNTHVNLVRKSDYMDKGIELVVPKEIQQSSLISRQCTHSGRKYAILSVVKFILASEKLKAPILILTMRRNYCTRLQKMLMLEGIKARVFKASYKSDTREKFLESAKAGKVPVTIACAPMLAEGVNVPAWTHLLVVNTWSSPSLTRQSTGRVERKFGNKSKGYVWDFVDKHPQCNRQFIKRCGTYRQCSTGSISTIHTIRQSKKIWQLKRRRNNA